MHILCLELNGASRGAGPRLARQAPTAFAGGEIDASNSRTYTGTAGAPVQFDCSGSTDDVGIAQYEWDFADQGDTGTGRKPKHAYAEAGAYRVILTVTDNQGATASDVTLAVIEPIGHPGKDTICIRGKWTVEAWPKVARYLIKYGIATPGECDDDQKK